MGDRWRHRDGVTLKEWSAHHSFCLQVPWVTYRCHWAEWHSGGHARPLVNDMFGGIIVRSKVAERSMGEDRLLYRLVGACIHVTLDGGDVRSKMAELVMRVDRLLYTHVHGIEGRRRCMSRVERYIPNSRSVRRPKRPEDHHGGLHCDANEEGKSLTSEGEVLMRRP